VRIPIFHSWTGYGSNPFCSISVRIECQRNLLAELQAVRIDHGKHDPYSARRLKAEHRPSSRSAMAWAEAEWIARRMRADVIHVMEEGRIVEPGSHGELIRRGGRYAESWKRQTEARAT
jgi:hypothetical protein